jgi:hypothetical protein
VVEIKATCNRRLQNLQLNLGVRLSKSNAGGLYADGSIFCLSCKFDWQSKHKCTDRLRRFVTRLKTLRCDNGLIIDEMSLGEWLSWAEAKIDQIDPLTAGVEDVFRSVSIAAKPPRIPWL